MALTETRIHARHVTGHCENWQGLLLIELKRQVIRVFEKGKTFTGKGIDANRFASHVVRLKMGNGPVDILNAERQMT